MAIPTLQTSGGFQSNAGGATYSNSFDAGSTGSDRCLIVAAFCDTSSTDSVDSVTYNGVSLTEVQQITAEYPNPWIVGVSLWRLVAPATGSNTLTVNYNSTVDTRAVFALVYSGVDQTTPIDVSAKRSSTAAVNPGVNNTIDLTTTVADCALVAALTEGDSTNAWAPVSPATERYDNIQEFMNTTVVTQDAASVTTHTIGANSGRSTAIDEGERVAIMARAVAPPASGTTVNVGQATETDTAQAVSIERTYSVAQATETDTAQAIAVRRLISVGQATETDTAQAVTFRKELTAGIATETDTAQPVTISRLIATGQATETDSALAVTIGSTATNVAVGQATETDTAQAVTIARGIDVGQATETDTAQAVAVITDQVIAVGQAVETDTAQSIFILGSAVITLLDSWSTVSTATSNFGSRTISAGNNRLLVVRVSVAGGSLREPTVVTYGGQEMTLVDSEATTSSRDFHTSLWVLDDAGIVAASTTDFDVTLDGSGSVQFRLQTATYEDVRQVTPVLDNYSVSATGGATPTSEALTTNNGGIAIVAAGDNEGTGGTDPDVDVSYSNMTERLEDQGSQAYTSNADAATDGTDFTPSLTFSNARVTHAVGMSLAFGTQTLAVGQAVETDTAQVVTAQRAISVGQVAEVDTAFAVVADTSTTVAVGQAVETDTAQQVVVFQPGLILLDTAQETDTAQPVTARRVNTVAVGQASETDTAQAIANVTKTQIVLQATETDIALPLVGFEPIDEDLLRRQKEAGSAAQFADLQADEAVYRQALQARIKREDDEMAMIIPAITRYLLRQ